MALQTENNILKIAKNRCRICLEATNGKIELNQKINYKETGILLSELLGYCVNEQVFENGQADGLCLDCMEKGMVCYEFKKKFEESQSVLMKEMEENKRFEIKIEEDFEEEGFVVEAEDAVLKDEDFDDEEKTEVTENPNKCDVCGKIYNSRSGMLRHKRQQHASNKPTDSPQQNDTVEHKCDVCEKTFKFRSTLTRHKTSHTQTVKTCNHCSYVTESSVALTQHMKTVHKDIPIVRKPIPCPTCGKIFFKKRNLCLHMLIHSGTKKHTCEYCGLSFTLAGNLATHRRIHTGEKPYTCSECGKSFTQHASWKSHQVVHSKQKDHVCQKCGAAFGRAGGLSNHVKTHFMQKPFECTICSKRFTTNKARKRHMVTHTGVQKYACEFCAKRFNRSSSLNVHRKIHTGETPHVCQICGKGFIQAHCLKTHLNTHSPNKNVKK